MAVVLADQWQAGCVRAWQRASMQPGPVCFSSPLSARAPLRLPLVPKGARAGSGPPAQAGPPRETFPP